MPEAKDPPHWHVTANARATSAYPTARVIFVLMPLPSPARRMCWSLLLAVLGTAAAHGQRSADHEHFDTAYVRDYSRILTARIYSSTKYNKLLLGGLHGGRAMIYRPNNKINFGIGASYHALTLNIGVGIPGINKDQEKRGETHYLDAQANLYTKRWATNLFLQKFRGYYISSHNKAEVGWVQDTELPTRPDLVQFNVGISTVHIFNNDRFSYRAAFNQDAWQRKSQGTLLAGGYFTYFHLNADSSIIPQRLALQYDDGLRLRRGGFLDLGPSLGYAYTLVIREHVFLTGSLVLGAGLSAQRATTLENTNREEKRTVVGAGWHSQFRAGAGWNGAVYYAGISFNQENVGYLIDDRSNFYWSVGNIRLNFARRFNLGHTMVGRKIRKVKQELDLPTG